MGKRPSPPGPRVHPGNSGLTAWVGTNSAPAPDELGAPAALKSMAASSCSVQSTAPCVSACIATSCDPSEQGTEGVERGPSIGAAKTRETG